MHACKTFPPWKAASDDQSKVGRQKSRSLAMQGSKNLGNVAFYGIADYQQDIA
jgi:hypothetical protein